MADRFGVVKSEPAADAWSQFVADGSAVWTGVRNYQARNNLRAMAVGDLVLFYHSVTDKAVVGVGRVKRLAYADPTATEGDWSCVDLEPVAPLVAPVSLDTLRADEGTCRMALVKNSRISVTPVIRTEYRRILELGHTKLA